MDDQKTVQQRLEQQLDNIEEASVKAADRIRKVSEEFISELKAVEKNLEKRLASEHVHRRLDAVEKELGVLRKSSQKEFATLWRATEREFSALMKASKNIAQALVSPPKPSKKKAMTQKRVAAGTRTEPARGKAKTKRAVAKKTTTRKPGAKKTVRGQVSTGR